MTNQDNNRQSKYNVESYKGQKPFNDIPCVPGEVLVPFVVIDGSMISSMGINRANMKTVHLPNGKKVPVAYTPVDVKYFDNALKAYYKDINEYLNQNSKWKNDAVSLEELSEKTVMTKIRYELQADGTELEHTETIVFKETAVKSHEEKLLMIEMIEELIELVYQRNTKYGKILKLIYSDVSITKQEIINKLGMKKTQGYEAIKKAQAMAKEVYDELNQ